MNIEIANRLHTLRKQHNLSQEELALKIGISRQAVSKWERAEASPDTDNLILLSKLYNVSIDELLKTDSMRISDDTPISLRKEDYASSGQSPYQFPKQTVPQENVIGDDGEIYPQNYSSAQQGSPYAQQSSPYANSSSGSGANDRIDGYVKNIEKEIEKVAAIIGNNIDSIGGKIKEEIKKKENEPKGVNNTGNGKYNYEWADNSYREKYEKIYKKSEKRSNKGMFGTTVKDYLIMMCLVILCAMTLSFGFPMLMLSIIFLIPTYITFVNARKRKNPMLFCYPTLVFMLFFLCGEFMMQYTWTLILTIPLYYTAIPAWRKKNPLIFCYPVLVTYIFLLTAVVSNGFFARWTWSLFLTIPFYYLICSRIMSDRKKNNQ